MFAEEQRGLGWGDAEDAGWAEPPTLTPGPLFTPAARLPLCNLQGRTITPPPFVSPDFLFLF